MPTTESPAVYRICPFWPLLKRVLAAESVTDLPLVPERIAVVTFSPARDLSLKGDMEIGSTLEALNSDQLTDEEVVERVKAGHTPLYEIIMRRYNQRLYRGRGRFCAMMPRPKT